VRVGNFDTLPTASVIILRFDLDNDAETGSNGDEALVRYSSLGTLDFFRWNGLQLAVAAAGGMDASFAAGVLTFSLARADLADATSFGIAAVTARTQVVGGASVVATDFAPLVGRSVYTRPGDAAFSDPEDDEDVAPDVSGISVSDSRDGRVTLRVTTANYEALPRDKLVGVGFDLLGRPGSSDEVFLTYQTGAGLIVEREVNGFLTQDTPPNRVATDYTNGVLTLDIHRSELESVARFRFSIITVDLTGDGEGEGDEELGEIEAVDFAPEGVQTGTLFTYKLANPPPVRLAAERPTRAPASSVAGKPFDVSVVVTRSDTGKALRAGSVRCTAFVGKARVAALGRFRGGKARCSVAVPVKKRPVRVHGTMTIRAAGASVRSSFSFLVR
jgi:hypothetical protein